MYALLNNIFSDQLYITSLIGDKDNHPNINFDVYS